MDIQTILILILISLSLSYASRKWGRINLIMSASVLVMFWLQPESSLRYLGFWLPAASLLLIIITWIVITPITIRKQPETTRTLIIVAGLIVLIYFLDIPGLEQILNISNAPGTVPLLLFLLASAVTAGLLSMPQRVQSTFIWSVFALLTGIFIILKTPSLALAASQAWRSLSGQSIAVARVQELQWLGYSYLAFRLLHTLRDQQAGRLAAVPLNEYIAYTIFFPTLIAGPIARINQIDDDLNRAPDLNRAEILLGSKRILIGLFKKFVVADSLAIFSLNSTNALQAQSSLGAWVLLYAYSLQIFLDFSGYTDIAIGLAQLLGIQLPENFNKPYLKPNLTQFCNNWHMTLTNWFRAYFFNPLSRILRRKKLPVLSILFITQISTMVLVGLWHGITINFAIWGLWHGLGLLVQNRWSSWAKTRLDIPNQGPWLASIQRALGVFLTFHYVTLGWIWFALPSPQMAQRFIGSLLGIT